MLQCVVQTTKVRSDAGEYAVHGKMWGLTASKIGNIGPRIDTFPDVMEGDHASGKLRGGYPYGDLVVTQNGHKCA